MAGEQHRHDISDRAREKIKPYAMRTLSFSKGGAVLLHATLKTPLLSLPLSKSVVLLFGSLFIDDTI